MITWWDIINALYTALLAGTTLDGVKVQLGASAEVPAAATVLLVRGGSTPPTKHDTVAGEQILFVECWEHGPADDNTVAYRRLALLEEKFRAALNAWVDSNPFPEAQISAVPGEFQPDGDIFRPSVGSRMELNIKWRPRPL